MIFIFYFRIRTSRTQTKIQFEVVVVFAIFVGGVLAVSDDADVGFLAAVIVFGIVVAMCCGCWCCC